MAPVADKSLHLSVYKKHLLLWLVEVELMLTTLLLFFEMKGLNIKPK